MSLNSYLEAVPNVSESYCGFDQSQWTILAPMRRGLEVEISGDSLKLYFFGRWVRDPTSTWTSIPRPTRHSVHSAKIKNMDAFDLEIPDGDQHPVTLHRGDDNDNILATFGDGTVLTLTQEECSSDRFKALKADIAPPV